VRNKNDTSDDVASVARQGEAHKDQQATQDDLSDHRGSQDDRRGEISNAADQNQDDVGVSGSSA